MLSNKTQVSKIFEKRGNYTLPEEKRLNELVIKVLVLYKRKILEGFREKLLKQINEIENTEDNREELETHLLKLQKINQVLQILSDQYGWVVF